MKKIGWDEENKLALKNAFGFLFSEELLTEIETHGQLFAVADGEILMDIGDTMQYMPILLEGAIKVLREDEEGDELLLYFLESGDTCAMTMSCCMGDRKSKVRTAAERDSKIIMVPLDKMSDWIQSYADWRTFVFDSYSVRLSELLESIDSLAFLNMHDRVYKYLKNKMMVNGDAELNVTHREIANDLHTSRVVISRILKSLEREGRIALHRNRLEILEW
ncbi:MAG: Crp/Fnr family transcriptional regulator [bacterium]|nr:Crp/Fnr family transcriptional regulator [bacterium]